MGGDDRADHGKRLQFIANQPVLSQITGHDDAILSLEAGIEFLARWSRCDSSTLTPDAMRIPSLPGQDILGDRGENLSSVLAGDLRVGSVQSRQFWSGFGN